MIKYTFTLITIMITCALHAQDTIRVNYSQEQVIKALIEKGFSINSKTDSTIITNPNAAYPSNTVNRNELIIRFKIFFTPSGASIVGEYRYNKRYVHQVNSDPWRPILNDRIHKFTWSVVLDFANYLKQSA